MALGRGSDPPAEEPATLAPVTDPEQIGTSRDPFAVELPDDDDDRVLDEDDDSKVIGTCERCGQPVLDTDPHHSEPVGQGQPARLYHAEHSETRARHDRAVRKSKRKYERSGLARQRAQQAREA